MSLPTLTGSQKQIAWAEKIRTNTVAYAEQMGKMVEIAQSEQRVCAMSDDERRDLIAQVRAVDGPVIWGHRDSQFFDVLSEIHTADRYAAFVNILRAQSSASFWIDTRNHFMPALIKRLSADVDAQIAA